MGPPSVAAWLIAAQIQTNADRKLNNMFKPSFGENLFVYGLFTGPLIAVGMHKLIYFSKARETKVINEFKRSHALPRKVKKELKPRFFVQPKNS
jgi:hypothetical protein